MKPPEFKTNATVSSSSCNTYFGYVLAKHVKCYFTVNYCDFLVMENLEFLISFLLFDYCIV